MTTESNDHLEAIQNVVDRVQSYQDGATEGTVESALRGGFEEAGVSVDPGDVTRLAEAIEAGDGPVHASAVLG